MADLKISQLANYTTPVDVDVLPIVDTTLGNTKKITWTNIKSAIQSWISSLILTLTNKTIDATVNTLPQVITLPTDLKISTASKGGVIRNIDGAVGDIAITSEGFIENETFNVFVANLASAWSAKFDSSVTKTGRLTVKLTTTNATGRCCVQMGYNGLSAASLSATRLAKYGIPLKPSTTYRVTGKVKYIGLVSASLFGLHQFAIDGTRIAGTSTTAESGDSNEFIPKTLTITTNASTAYGVFMPAYSAVGDAQQIWVDWNSLTIEEVVTNTTFAGKVAEKIRLLLQAVTSTDNIDNSLDPAGAYANTYALTNAVNEGATHIQTFTPTKKYISQIGIWPVASGTGVNWTLVVHNSANGVLYTQTILAASIVTGAMQYFDVPNVWISGALHFHLYASATTGTPTCKVNTANDLETASYIQRYAKNTEGFSEVCNGIKTELKADKDGLLSNSIIDLDNSKYKSFFDFGDVTSSNVTKVVSALFGATFNNVIGGLNLSVNGLGFLNANDYQTIKVNTVLPIKHLKLQLTTAGITGSGELQFYISSDNVTFTSVAATVGANISPIIETDVFNGRTIFYIKVAGFVTGIVYWKSVNIEADLDTSSIPQGLFYPLAVNQFAETWKATDTVLSYVKRNAKHTNDYGVVVPSIELNSSATGNGTDLGHICQTLDNSQEAAQSVKILTASGIASDTVLDADGEYVALSAGATEGSINYQVGTGSTCTAITKNTMYLSSNSESVDSTQDPSLQGNFIVGVRQQGLTDRVKDISSEIEDVKNGVVKTSIWNNWIPVLTWTTGTPEGSVVTKARYKILDGVCYFAFYYSATDANGATALTISLPVLPKDNDSLTALQSQELADTTWSNPIAYIDDGGTSIVFRSFATIADTKAVKVLVSGSYEI